jgi:hypothetical protein
MVTAGLIAWQRPTSLIDPACGDASVVAYALELVEIPHIELGDISEPNVEHALELGFAEAVWKGRCDVLLERTKSFDLVVLTEILEHLEDPDTTLRLARKSASVLVASSPVMRPSQRDENPEHVWMFDKEGYEEMLRDSGWRPFQYTFLRFESIYDFGIWVCS